MTHPTSPPVPDHLPEEALPSRRDRADRQSRRRSRYDRPRRQLSWIGLILGLALGLAGALYYTWEIAPVQELDIAPWQLNEQDRDHYVVAAILNYSHNGDLARTIELLNALRLPGNDPIQAVADTACRLASAGYVNSTGGLNAIHSLMTFYQNQGRTGCADTLIGPDTDRRTAAPVIVLPTLTPMPPASKTPTPQISAQPTATSALVTVPTNPPARTYDLIAVSTFCDVDISGVIEVRVRDYAGQETPGRPVRVRWNGGESLFFTGLKPERGRGYADFQMEPDLNYVVEMPGLSDPISEPLLADTCYTESGDVSVYSYRLVFQGG